MVLAGGLAVLSLLCWAVIARAVAPRFNTDQSRFDAIIVLGDPADSDGNPTPVQISRITEAVHEYERNVAPRLILTGGAAHNRFVEARVMAQVAEAQGIPASAIIEEPLAMNTIQNACYATRIVKAHGWNSVEVISNSFQLPRAALIFSHLPLKWRVHAAPSFAPKSRIYQAAVHALETVKTVHYLIYGEWAEHCQP
ncbi:MAG TPA: YdcF family protein [Terracidiphilus sp.]|nr:YdcF family protein [Terracidiphilus sp.]